MSDAVPTSRRCRDISMFKSERRQTIERTVRTLREEIASAAIQGIATAAGSVRFGAIATSIGTSLRTSGAADPDYARLERIDGITHSGVVGASPDRTVCPAQVSIGNATDRYPGRRGDRPSRSVCNPARRHQIDCWSTARENLSREPKPRSGRSIHDRGEQSDDRTRCRRNSDLPVGGPAESENRFEPKPIARACGSRSVPWRPLPNGAG